MQESTKVCDGVFDIGGQGLVLVLYVGMSHVFLLFDRFPCLGSAEVFGPKM